MSEAERLIDALQLSPHPEGGWYRETWRADGPGRPSGTAILFLLPSGTRSHWHHVDATEIWHYHAGAPLRLLRSGTDSGPAEVVTLGPDVLGGQTPQAIIPPRHWQSAESTGAYTLVSCTVSPGFSFDGFVLAAPDFDIPAR